MATKRLPTLSEVMPVGYQRNSVRERKARNPKGHNLELLERCRQSWENKRELRETRERVKQYCYGDQWGDYITYKGERMTERKYIQKKGNVPLSNNIMISVANTLTGLYSKQNTEPMCFARVHDTQKLSDMMSATLQANWQDTSMPDLLKVVFEDGLFGGVKIVRETYEDRDQVLDSWTDYVNPNYAFWEGGSDPRYKDFTLIGMLHDIDKEELFAKFAKPEYGLTVDDLKGIFDIADRDSYDSTLQQNDKYQLSNISFDTCQSPSKYRVIEAWSREIKPRYQCIDPIANNSNDAYFRVETKDINQILKINKERKKVYDEAGVPKEQRAYIKTQYIEDLYWYYTFMAPDGTILCEGETPYDYHSHPFTISLFPYVNGEVHPYMGYIIDQQRYINRLIIMHDMAARSAAKGITIIPKDCIPDDMTPEDFAQEFTEYDGLIFYETSKLNPSLRPEVITSNAVQIGTYELLNLQLSLIKDISNVSGALQGKTPSAGTAASRYAQETQNSTTSLYTILQEMSSFTERLARKKVDMIKQYYEDGRIIFNKDHTDVFEYDRWSARDVDYLISVKEAAATAAYQTQINDILTQLLQMNAISIKQYLQSSNLPFKDDLLADIEANEQAQAQMAAQQQAMQQMQAQQTPQQQQQTAMNTQMAQQALQYGLTPQEPNQSGYPTPEEQVSNAV
jgi:hypothetical protein